MKQMLLYRTQLGPVVQVATEFYVIDMAWDALMNRPGLPDYLLEVTGDLTASTRLSKAMKQPLPPLVSQEVWAAGVTYFRSRTARMEESEVAGGGNFYDRVYEAPRPELFLKATAHRVVGTGESMKLRSDSNWIVPEPELVLAINSQAQIVGYTIGNDLSCRDIEGENPLYLPQAKTFDRCAAVGPGILISQTAPEKETAIRLTVRRDGEKIVEDSTTLSQMKRGLEELVGYLFRDNSFPQGCLLMTGTGIVPPPDFSLQSNDVVEITIDGIGTLINTME
jgi:2-dehydro-3-deoxy-D-arabinonate dehydratase